MEPIKIGQYKHFKGGLCDVIGVARHSETLEEMVVYRHADPAKGFEAGELWVRPKENFLKPVNVNGQETPRFTFLE